MQTVKLDKLIKLFDSPGIVMSKETNPASLVLRNCVRVSENSMYYQSDFFLQIETIENPVPAIELLLNRCSKEQVDICSDAQITVTINVLRLDDGSI